jgi:hypothetical protein
VSYEMRLEGRTVEVLGRGSSRVRTVTTRAVFDQTKGLVEIHAETGKGKVLARRSDAS